MILQYCLGLFTSFIFFSSTRSTFLEHCPIYPANVESPIQSQLPGAFRQSSEISITVWFLLFLFYFYHIDSNFSLTSWISSQTVGLICVKSVELTLTLLANGQSVMSRRLIKSLVDPVGGNVGVKSIGS